METKHLLVGAIDIGSTYSGWGFSLEHEFVRDPTEIVVRRWDAGQLVTSKAPTCVLIKPDGKTLDAFGFAADYKYNELTQEGKNVNYYYFKQFKMQLNKKLQEKNTLDRSVTLEDDIGRSLPALGVYAMCIKYLVDDMKDQIFQILGSIRDKEIYWVLTVPGAWSEGVKQFLQEAAFKAGCGRNNLAIVPEPEAALIYCRHLSDEQTVYNTNGSLSQFTAGTKYMILDAGGDVNISVNEVGESGRVKQLSIANAGCIGGISVDNAFKDMLKEVFGKAVYEKFQNENEDFLELSIHFESEKRRFEPHLRTVTMRLPMSLIDASIEEKSFSDALARSHFQVVSKFLGYKIRLNTFNSFFEVSVTSIIRCVKEILRHEKVEAILMVGGYSDSKVLQEAVRTSFPDINLVVPTDASDAVIKGAIIFGHSLRYINEYFPRCVVTTLSDKENGAIDISKPDNVVTKKKFSRSQVDGSDFVHDIQCTPCSEDDTNVEAEYHCTNCRTYFCSKCVSHHNKVFKKHTLLDKNTLGFDQGIQSSSASGSSTLKDVCKIHAGEVVKMYCNQHDVVCCTVCVAVDHRTCDGVKYIPQIAKELLKPNDERSTIASLRQMKASLEGLRLKRECDFLQAEELLDVIETKAKNMKTHIVRRTETLEKASIDKARQLHRSIADGISSDIKSLEDMLEGIDKELSNLESENSEDEVQLFAQVKQAQQECLEGNKCMKSIQARDDRKLNFQIDKEIESTLDRRCDFWM